MFIQALFLDTNLLSDYLCIILKQFKQVQTDTSSNKKRNISKFKYNFTLTIKPGVAEHCFNGPIKAKWGPESGIHSGPILSLLHLKIIIFDAIYIYIFEHRNTYLQYITISCL